MEIFSNLFTGFYTAFQPDNLIACFFGVLIGTLVGVLPGIGPVGAMSILLPVTFHMSPTSAIIMLAGIYYGSMYGGSTTSILVNIPGEAASVVTCMEGHEMAKKGRAGAALGIAAFGSFIAGTLGLIGLMVFAAPLSGLALKFGYPEYFGVVLLGLTLIVYLSQASVLKGIMMGLVGIILSTVGLDPVFGSSRMTFNFIQLADGLGMVPVAMGLFGISEVLINLEEGSTGEILKAKIKSFFPSILEWKRSTGPILRGSLLGFFLGILPGGGSVISSFASYGLEKKLSKEPEQFGKGAIEGLAGPESANNSATAGAFVPLFTLGIPANVVMALLFGALIIHGMQPGPFFIKQHADIFWGVISSMYVGNIMLLVLNLPLVPMWVQVLKVPYKILFPLILLFCIVGSYGINNNVFDVLVMIIFGLIGYLFRKFGYESAPLILSFVLGPILELSLRQSLLLSNGSFLIFFTHPISAIAILLATIMFITSLVTPGSAKRFLRRLQGSDGSNAGPDSAKGKETGRSG
ncbi:MAG: tripartite tricarboxylate transporter permease [Desulfobacteraceae bacterium]|nr:MAG: tripartite tricarboxylate transporter permease [Desulfobacteraceae bacterium]